MVMSLGLSWIVFVSIFDFVFVFVCVFSCKWRWRWWWWWRGQWWVYSRMQVRTSEQFSALTSWHDSPSWPWTCTRVLRSAFSFGSGHDIAVILRNVDRFFILKVSVIQSLLRCVPKKSFTFIQNEDISCRFFSKCWPDKNQNQEFNPSRCWAFCQIYKKKCRVGQKNSWPTLY